MTAAPFSALVTRGETIATGTARVCLTGVALRHVSNGGLARVLGANVAGMLAAGASEEMIVDLVRDWTAEWLPERRRELAAELIAAWHALRAS